VQVTGYAVPGWLVAAIGLVIVAVMVGWMVWGYREYRRTRRAQWLWMAGVMLLSLGAGLARVI
jgi:hypothetical protein